MPIRLQLQDSRGNGCKINIRSATLTVNKGVLQIGQCNFLSFLSGELEVFHARGSRHFGVGEGFASIGEAGFSLVTDRYLESPSAANLRALPVSGPARLCAVCEKELNDDLHCITINETPVHLCCPHCAESFRRATRIIRQAYPVGQAESDKK